VTACEYTIDGGATWQTAIVAGTMPTFTCEASGIVGTHGQVLRLSMRATSEGGTAQATVLQVTVDAVPPAGTVAINGGASFTKVPTVTLTLSATDASGLADMCISNVPSCSTWLPFAKTKSWSLPAGDGVKPVYAWFPVLLPLSALRACRGIHGGGSTTRVSSVASGRLGRRGFPLRVLIATLFVALIASVGIAIVGYGYVAAS
jgi:hypothetical protein